MKSRELKALERERAESASQIRPEKATRSERRRDKTDRLRRLHNEVLGEFRALGAIDLGDSMTSARTHRRVA